MFTVLSVVSYVYCLLVCLFATCNSTIVPSGNVISVTVLPFFFFLMISFNELST